MLYWKESKEVKTNPPVYVWYCRLTGATTYTVVDGVQVNQFLLKAVNKILETIYCPQIV